MTSLLLLIQPVSSVILAAIILGEDPSTLQIGGVAVILAVVVYATSARRTPVPVPTQ